MPIFVPKNKKNSVKFSYFHAFQEYFAFQVDHPSTTMSHTNHTKKMKEEEENSWLPSQNRRYHSISKKNHQYFSKIPILRRAKHPPNFCYTPPNFAQKPKKSVNFQQISLKIPSNTAEIRVFTSKLVEFTSKYHNLSSKINKPSIWRKMKNTTENSHTNHLEVGREDETKSQKSKKRESRKEKEFFFLIIFLFTI